MFLDTIKLATAIRFFDKPIKLCPAIKLTEKREIRERLRPEPKPAGS